MAKVLDAQAILQLEAECSIAVGMQAARQVISNLVRDVIAGEVVVGKLGPLMVLMAIASESRSIDSSDLEILGKKVEAMLVGVFSGCQVMASLFQLSTLSFGNYHSIAAEPDDDGMTVPTVSLPPGQTINSPNVLDFIVCYQGLLGIPFVVIFSSPRPGKQQVQPIMLHPDWSREEVLEALS